MRSEIKGASGERKSVDAREIKYSAYRLERSPPQLVDIPKPVLCLGNWFGCWADCSGRHYHGDWGDVGEMVRGSVAW